MKSFVFIFALSISWTAFSAPASDCTLEGEGRVFNPSLDHGSYTENQTASYKLIALRFPLGSGKYLYQETKKFVDQKPDQVTFFIQSQAVGPYDFAAKNGSLQSSGFCTRIGHCMGTLKIPSVNFVGQMTTDFDAEGIRTVTFNSDGSFVDEVLKPAGKCP